MGNFNGHGYFNDFLTQSISRIDKESSFCNSSVGPSFEKPLAEKSDGVDGTNVVLEVKVKGIPMPELAWFKVRKTRFYCNQTIV